MRMRDSRYAIEYEVGYRDSVDGRYEALQTVAKQKGCTDSYYGAVKEEEGRPDNARITRLNLTGAIGHGVVEIAVFFDIEDLFLQGTRKFIKAIREIDAERGIEGFGGVVVFGEVWERIARREGGEEGRAPFTKTQDFTDITKYLMQGTSAVEMFHVGFRRIEG
ncbi:hypothetical protein DID88_007682 [Monilinia fructigena]|uniref:Uncharacterized protein n=1 Tax=Monilinia fructigena TaxID=38457 RepID=A0A395J352_9HELO|nr:hypothetical protein DID88_007682 [Monilinia fructigena]